jgi:hypothetical protein
MGIVQKIFRIQFDKKIFQALLYPGEAFLGQRTAKQVKM